MLLKALTYAILVGGALPCLYYLAVVICARSFFRRQDKAGEDFSPPVSVLKPMRGLEREAYENISSFCRLDYPEYEILFAVDAAEDPVVPLLRRLMAEFPDRSIRLIIGSEAVASNNKVAKVSLLAREARYDLLVVNDSDIRVGRDYLRRVVSPFRDVGVGVVTCLYRGMPSRNLWSELEDINLTSDFMGAVLVARKLGVNFALGATMGVSRPALKRIGGFEALADAAADDHELGYRAAACGYRVELAQTTVQTQCSSGTLRDYFAHHLRWAVVTRQSAPWGHVGFVFAQGLPWAVAAAAVAPSRLLATGYLAAYLACRMAAAFSVGVWGLQDPWLRRRWWLVPLHDAFAFLIWLASLFRNRVRWQESEYYVQKGRLIPIISPPVSEGGAKFAPARTSESE